MATLKVPSTSREYVVVPVLFDGPPGFSPLVEGVPVDMLFGTDVEPTVDDAGWTPAEWEVVRKRFRARCLIGPGAKVLAEGSYVVWLRFTDTEERPVRQAGKLTVT